MEKQLSQQELCDLLPYLRKELEIKKEIKGEYGEVIAGEYSKLESAVLITDGRKHEFPNPHMQGDVQDTVTYTYETQVELADKKGKLIKRLEKSWERSFNITQKIHPYKDRGTQGEITTQVLRSMKRKPEYVVIKRIRTSETFSGTNIEIHRYNIKVYQMR